MTAERLTHRGIEAHRATWPGSAPDGAWFARPLGSPAPLCASDRTGIIAAIDSYLSESGQ